MSYSAEVVNCNYKSTLGKPINLSSIHAAIPNSKLYTRPTQLVIKDPKGTLVFFGNGKHRVMGCIDELDATFLAYKYVAMIDKTNDNFQLVFSQSSTVRVLFHKIHLQKLVQVISNTSSSLMHYEPEIFRQFSYASTNHFQLTCFQLEK